MADEVLELTRAAEELHRWREQTDATADRLDHTVLPGLRSALLDALWATRTDGTRGTRAELLVAHLLAGCAPEEMQRHRQLICELVRALGPQRREELLDRLGEPGALRRRYVETLSRPTTACARVYAAY